MLKKLVAKIFKPNEVKLVLATLDVEAKRINDRASHILELSIGYDLIKSELRQMIIDSPAIIKKKLGEENTDPRALIYLLVKNISTKHLASGQFHIYRGVLSLQGSGLKVLVIYALENLRKLDRLSKEEIGIQLAMLNEDIAGAG